MPFDHATALELSLSDETPPKVTLQANGESLDEVLSALAEAADFDLEIDGTLGERKGSWRFRDRPLPAVLESVTKGLGLTIFYADIGAQRSTIIEVHVHGTGGRTGVGTRADSRSAPRQPTTNDDTAERRTTLDTLSGHTDPGNLALISGYMRNDPAMEIRRHAIDMLARQSGENAYEWLDPCLVDVEAGVRAHCVKAMGQLQTPEVAAAMSQLLYGEEDRQVKLAILNTLAQQANAQAGLILDSAARDPGLGVEAEAAQAYARWQARQTETTGESQANPQ